jgi:hypothetical protein
MKRYGGIALSILNLGVRWRSVVSFKPRLFYMGKKPLYPLDRRLQNPFQGCGEEKILFFLLGINPRFLRPSPRSLVAIPIELSRKMLVDIKKINNSIV